MHGGGRGEAMQPSPLPTHPLRLPPQRRGEEKEFQPSAFPLLSLWRTPSLSLFACLQQSNLNDEVFSLPFPAATEGVGKKKEVVADLCRKGVGRTRGLAATASSVFLPSPEPTALRPSFRLSSSDRQQHSNQHGSCAVT